MNKSLLCALCCMMLASPVHAKIESNYESLLSEHENSSTMEKMLAVNNFYNQFDYEPQSEEVDWKSPKKFRSDKSGETIDFATAKFFALEALGINNRKMKIVHGYIDGFSEPIMALSVYDEKAGKKYILDKFIDEIKANKQRQDLEVIYAFDKELIWTQRGYAGEASMIKQWSNLLDKV